MLPLLLQRMGSPRSQPGVLWAIRLQAMMAAVCRRALPQVLQRLEAATLPVLVAAASGCGVWDLVGVPAACWLIRRRGPWHLVCGLSWDPVGGPAALCQLSKALTWLHLLHAAQHHFGDPAVGQAALLHRTRALMKMEQLPHHWQAGL